LNLNTNERELNEIKTLTSINSNFKLPLLMKKGSHTDKENNNSGNYKNT